MSPFQKKYMLENSWLLYFGCCATKLLKVNTSVDCLRICSGVFSDPAPLCLTKNNNSHESVMQSHFHCDSLRVVLKSNKVFFMSF